MCVSGKVVKRSDETINKDLFTGEVEIKVSSFEVLSESKELPMPVFGEQDYPEETRLKYRFIDLRRDEMHENIVLRSKVISRSEEHTSELQSLVNLVCRLLLEKKNNN